jgi:mannitol/fructose-specific phosphotransferase system IIA component (Ntr-type)
LLVPEESCELQLDLLAQLAEIFSDRRFMAALRATGSSTETLALLKREVVVHAA